MFAKPSDNRSSHVLRLDLKEIIAPVIGFARRSSNMPRNNLASFCGALKDVDCSELEATQAAFSEIDEEMKILHPSMRGFSVF